MNESQRKALRQRLNQPGLVVAPGVFDMVSLRLADSFGFDALYMTGYGTVASHMGLPDAGLATYSLLAGKDRYKQSLSTGAEELHWLCAERFAPGLGLGVLGALRARAIRSSTVLKPRSGRASITSGALGVEAGAADGRGGGGSSFLHPA